MPLTTGPPVSRYRPEIDGLRALAVVLVLLFHAGLPRFAGGFLGVDVFFVISGYLISGMLIEGFTSGRPVFKTFWVRRVRRLLPAMVTVLLATCVLFAPVFPPIHYQRLAETARAQILLVSNVFLWSKSTYFDYAATLNPLLHTWSLSVEEQFYLVFPFVVWGLIRYTTKKGAAVSLAIACAASFAGSVVMTARSPNASFYFLPTRSWELGLGALLAFSDRLRERSSAGPSVIRELASLAGVVSILAASVLCDSATPTPSFPTLAPVVGTALVIWSNTASQTAVGRVLSLRPVVLLGLVSYSLYLWHWPVITLYRVLAPVPSVWGALGAALASVPIAYLSWRFVESPFRSARTSDRVALGASAAAVALVSGCVVLAFVTQGLPQRFDRREVEPTPPPRTGECFDRFAGGRVEFCEVGARGAHDSVDFIVIGDSHAVSFLPVIDAAAAELGMSGLFAGVSECLPLIGVVPLRPVVPAKLCESLVQDTIERARRGAARSVVFAARWTYYTDVTPYDLSFNPVGNRGDRDRSVEHSRAVFETALERTVAVLDAAGTPSYFLAQVPHQPFDPYTLQRRNALHGRFRADLTFAEHRRVQQYARGVFDRIAPARVVDFERSFCRGSSTCEAFHDGVPLYLDDDHLSLEGSLHLLPEVRGWLGALRAETAQLSPAAMP